MASTLSAPPSLKAKKHAISACFFSSPYLQGLQTTNLPLKRWVAATSTEVTASAVPHQSACECTTPHPPAQRVIHAALACAFSTSCDTHLQAHKRLTGVFLIELQLLIQSFFSCPTLFAGVPAKACISSICNTASRRAASCKDPIGVTREQPHRAAAALAGAVVQLLIAPLL